MFRMPNSTKVHLISDAGHQVIKENERDFLTAVHNFMGMIPKEEL